MHRNKRIEGCDEMKKLWIFHQKKPSRFAAQKQVMANNYLDFNFTIL